MLINEIPINDRHTPITEELFNKLDSQSITEFYDIFERIAFVKNLTSPTRQRAIDRPRDRKGRVKVDLTNPHILEDMAFFTERAQYYQLHGVYTHLYPNRNPNGEYKRFWDEERRRCIEGHVRPDDGEWIPGYFYFYLNYSPIDIVKEEEQLAENIDRIATEENFDEFVEGIRSDRIEDFPKVWDGDYIFFHYIEQAEQSGQHATVLKCRGRGYSFKGASMLARNYFLVKKSKSFAFAAEQEFLLKDGTLTKCWNSLNYIDNHTPWTQPRDYKDTEMEKRASYRDVDNKTEKGFLSQVIGVTCKNDPDKGRGKRGKLLFFDESGKFPGLKQTWTIARKSVEQGRYVFGCMLTAGTGGTVGANFEAAEEFFYYPKGYGIKALPNVFDKTNGHGECGLFIPEYLNREGCYDENGNSNVTAALIETLRNRQKIRNNTIDISALTKEKAESPITPQESVLRVEGSIFPVSDLKEYLAEISPSMARFLAPHWIGNLIIDNNGDIKLVSDHGNLSPIRDFPLNSKENKDKLGAVEVFEVPARVRDNFRYIIGVDTYDDDDVNYSTSLGSCIVFDRWTRRIVAEYTGRPNTAHEFYEVVYRMAKYYNASIMYENNKKGLYAYFSMAKKSLHMLAETPEFITDKQIIKPKNIGSNTSKGINATNQLNTYGRRLQADWMLENAYEEVVKDLDDIDGEIVAIPNYKKIRSIGYIKECIAWNPEINTDRISAMNMVMIYDMDLTEYGTKASKERVSTLANDKFFNRFGRQSVANKYN